MFRTNLRAISLAAFSSALALALSIGSAAALQTTVTQVDKNADGTMTYHFALKLDAAEVMAAGDKAEADFFTIYNFYGLVDGSAKAPQGWTFSSEQFGRTPTVNGYPLVLPVDVPNTPNLTWTPTQPVAAGASIEGFAATTKSTSLIEGEYSALVTRQAPATKGAPAGTEKPSKQAQIGFLPTPAFLAR